MRESSKCPRVEPSSTAPPPSSTGTTSGEASTNPVGAVPPPSTLDDFDICRTLKTVMTIQAAHGQLLMDVLTELQPLRADLVSIRRSPPPPPFDDES